MGVDYCAYCTCCFCSMSRSGALVRVAELLEEQFGMVTAAQAAVHGVQRYDLARLLGDGVLDQPARGVYRIIGAPGDLETIAIRAAWMQLRPGMTSRERGPNDGVVAYDTAAVLHGLGDLLPEPYQFLVPIRQQTRRTDVRIRRGRLEPGECARVKGMTVTSPARTIADLAADAIDGGHLGQIIADAIHRELVDRARVEDVLKPHLVRYGIRSARGAVPRTAPSRRRMTAVTPTGESGGVPYATPHLAVEDRDECWSLSVQGLGDLGRLQTWRRVACH